MGPVIAEESKNRPLRPRFSWDARNAPWTDGIGDQLCYAESVSDWSAFHDNLEDNNSNKISKKNRGIVLMSNLYGRAKDMIRSVRQEVLDADDGTNIVVDVVYKKDPLSVVTHVFDELQLLLSTRRSERESFLNFEQRFCAQLAKFNALGEAVSLNDAMAALYLLANANTSPSQRLSILAAASPRQEGLSPRSELNDFLTSIKYETIATVLRQCDKNESLSASSAKVGHDREKTKYKLTRAQLLARKASKPCHKCGKYGHWQNEHLPDGSLPKNTTSSDNPVNPMSVTMPNREINTTDVDKKPTNSNVLHFNMATIEENVFNSDLGPMVDNGAPYSAIGYDQLFELAPMIKPEWIGELDDVPDEFLDCPHWQYGTGNHASESRKIIGSTYLTAQVNNEISIAIRFLVLQGSSHWVVGDNITSKAVINMLDDRMLTLPHPDGSRFKIDLLPHDRHIYMPISIFRQTFSKKNSPYLSAATASVDKHDWTALYKIIDKVHKHVCGHSSPSDMKILLQRNGLLTDTAIKYLHEVTSKCPSCRCTDKPQPSRKVSLSTLSRCFNDVVCVDHMFLEEMCVFHAMDSHTRYSVGLVVDNTSLEAACQAFEICWLSTFWPPTAVSVDQTFQKGVFKRMLQSLDIKTHNVPPRRHSKNVLESKHSVIRSIYMRLIDASPDLSKNIAAQQALRISNDLYGSSVASAFEMARGFTRPVNGQPHALPDDVYEAQMDLLSKRKMTKILQSKSTTDSFVSTGDMVEVFVRDGKHKRGHWTSPRGVLSFDPKSWTVTVAGSSGKTMNAAIEDVRFAVEDQDFALMVRDANDKLDDDIQFILSNFSCENPQVSNVVDDSSLEQVPYIQFEPDYSAEPCRKPTVGDKISVYWPLMDSFYDGHVHEISGDRHIVYYDDGDVETLTLENENWNFCSANVSTCVSLETTRVCDLNELFNYFGNRSFMKFEAQAFPQYLFQTAYDEEENSFKKTVKEIRIQDLPENANTINSHVLYKIKVNDDMSLKLKARIAPHGNEDSLKNELRTDCSMCPPVGLRIIVSVASLNRWRLSKTDATSSFLQTGSAARDVYVLTPKESPSRGNSVWLLLTAAYGLCNSNAKFQVQSDELLHQIGFSPIPLIPQLFIRKENDKIVAMVCKVVDDLLLAGSPIVVDPIIIKINNRFKLGTVSHGPGKLRFFGLNIVQQDDFSVTIDSDDKLEKLESYMVPRKRRRELKEPLNSVELRSYVSLNCSLCWIGTNSSIFCAELASRLQQKANKATVQDHLEQQRGLRKVKRLGTLARYKNIQDALPHVLSIVVFADAGRHYESAQICYVAGLLIDEIKQGSIFHLISWSSHKAKRPVRSTGASEILAAGEAIDEGKILCSTLTTIFNVQVGLHVLLDSKDLFLSLSTQRQSVDRSIRADVNVIRYEFECNNITQLSWIPGKVNIADPGTKAESPLVEVLQLTL